MKLLIFVILVAYIVGLGAANDYSCLKINSCSCKLVGLQGEIGVIDLAHIQKRVTWKHDYATLHSNSYDIITVDTDRHGYLYRFFPCAAVNLGADVGTCDKQNDVSICQIYPNKTMSEEPMFTSCGNQSTADYTVLSVTPHYNVLLYFDMGEFDEGREEYRQSKIELICNKSETSRFEILGEYPTLTYNFRLTSKYACPVLPSQWQFQIGLGVIAALLLSTILYLGIGSSVNALCQKKSGLEIIPNYHFWREVPALCMDGCLFCLSLLYKPAGRRISRYELNDSSDCKREYDRIE